VQPAFTTQRLSVAVHYSVAQEVAEALGLSVLGPTRERHPTVTGECSLVWRNRVCGTTNPNNTVQYLTDCRLQIAIEARRAR